MEFFWDCFETEFFGTVLRQSSFETCEDRVVTISVFLAVLLTGIIKINIFAVNRLGHPQKVCRSAILELTLSREALGPIGPSVFKGQQLKA